MRCLKTFKFKLVVLISPLFFLLACQQVPRHSGLILPNFWSKSIVTGSDFNHLLIDNLKPPSKLLHVYIEGDGKPLNYLGLPSHNPSPDFPLALELMRKEKVRSFYVGRPCYFEVYSAGCNKNLWTEERYSQSVVNSLSKVVSNLAEESKMPVALIGFSGGGTLATLVANQNQHVEVLISINANLDLDQWTNFHATRPLSNSLNPIQQKKSLNEPGKKIFLVGDRDLIVPSIASKNYVKRHGGELIEYADFTHSCCWLDIWESFLEKIKTFD